MIAYYRGDNGSTGAITVKIMKRISTGTGWESIKTMTLGTLTTDKLLDYTIEDANVQAEQFAVEVSAAPTGFFEFMGFKLEVTPRKVFRQ